MHSGALAILSELAKIMPSNSLHSPLSSGEELFPDGNADLNDVYSNQNDHKKSKHRKHGKQKKSKKNKKHRSSHLHLEETADQQQSSKHRKHKSSKHEYDSNQEMYDFESSKSQHISNNKPLAGCEDFSDTELHFKDDKLVCF